MQEERKIELQNLAGGALQELFENDFEKVIENIYDKNTSAKTMRKLTMELKLKPVDESREIISVDIDIRTKLAPVEGVKTKLLLDKNGNKIVATEFGNTMKGQVALAELDENFEEVEEDNKVKPLFKAE
ncbi:MAG: replication terminator protein [Treponema sp.]|nr:replication terminator protein [Treponema sp.]MBP3630245.1 replication terminator protein [Clostridia bacterium]